MVTEIQRSEELWKTKSVYQLDMEMAFASQEDVFSVVEQVLPPVFEEYGIYKQASKAPFVRIPYLEAMDKYGSDKPDLRTEPDTGLRT